LRKEKIITEKCWTHGSLGLDRLVLEFSFKAYLRSWH